ncbi:hypothetical protein [Nocardiopsis lambiniae]|uniref:DUF2207 domain-containing protein n=1 Tax=Nocardiopsis lambiniae TaxID=3075539 RepID=A0ABU2MIR1_9ACTN|nr:hypothetical protein [Nocardiopsis sp. DSM 44743]MDT0331731.1 hypothetical protein [Nocardiopsis sp. DSM 44743]
MTDRENDGYEYEDDDEEVREQPDDYPFTIDRRYGSTSVTPYGEPPVEALVERRGEPDPEGRSELVEPGEMAFLILGRGNATQVLVDQEPRLGAVATTHTIAHERVRWAMDRLRRISDEARKELAVARRDIANLKERFAHVPADLKMPASRWTKVFMVIMIGAFATLDMWFFYKFFVIFWEFGTETTNPLLWALGPMLGALVALMVWVSGRILGSALWHLRASYRERPAPPPEAVRGDGRPRPWMERTAQRTRWNAHRLGERYVFPLTALVLAGWSLAVVTLFGFFRTWTDEQLALLPGGYVALLIFTLGLGALVLEMLVHNPYLEKLTSARSGAGRAYRRVSRAADEVSDALEHLAVCDDTLYRHRDEALSLARIEMDRVWSGAILPARHRSGRSGSEAPEPAVLADRGKGVHRLSRVPDDEEIEAFFLTFEKVPVPPPALGPVGSVNEQLRRYDPESLRRELRDLTTLPEVEEPVEGTPAVDDRVEDERAEAGG